MKDINTWQWKTYHDKVFTCIWHSDEKNKAVLLNSVNGN